MAPHARGTILSTQFATPCQRQVSIPCFTLDTASELELPQPPPLQAFQPTRSRGWAAGHQMLTRCTSVNLTAPYYIFLQSSPLHQAANMQVSLGNDIIYIFISYIFHYLYYFPHSLNGSYLPTPLHSPNFKLINVTSLIRSKIQSIFASSNILFPWVFFGECHLPVGSWLK